ncbi:MAG: SlyX family protein [Gammaproteobacteria bacterium]
MDEETALEKIELRIAYLESTNQELSDIVYQQQREIEALRTRFAAFAQRLDAWYAEQSESAPADERPPHY